MKIIDAHMHFSNIASFMSAAADAGVEYSREGFMRECRENGVEKSICMGLSETGGFMFPDKNAATPMNADLDEPPDGMLLCPGINPYRLDAENLYALENLVKTNKNVVGIKIYAGYYHFDIYDEIYEPVYRIALNNNLPVVIHCGDTFSEDALLEYAHPLKADRLAVKHRDMNIVICHLGNPWIKDACEVAYKNRNVYLDISGLYIGDAAQFKALIKNRPQASHFTNGLAFLSDYRKILFGTDWPLAPMNVYIDFCKRIIPKHAYDDVFYNNAKKLFSL